MAAFLAARQETRQQQHHQHQQQHHQHQQHREAVIPSALQRTGRSDLGLEPVLAEYKVLRKCTVREGKDAISTKLGEFPVGVILSAVEEGETSDGLPLIRTNTLTASGSKGWVKKTSSRNKPFLVKLPVRAEPTIAEYKVLSKCTVRAQPPADGVEPKTNKVGSFSAGTILSVVEQSRTADGRVVVRTNTLTKDHTVGWVKVESSKGRTLLLKLPQSALVESTASLAAMHVQSTLPTSRPFVPVPEPEPEPEPDPQLLDAVEQIRWQLELSKDDAPTPSDAVASARSQLGLEVEQLSSLLDLVQQVVEVCEVLGIETKLGKSTADGPATTDCHSID
jgi:hypothetical protein